MNLDTSKHSYFSTAGYRMWGGQSRVPGKASQLTLVSLGLMLGVAAAIATYLAMVG
jgi:hypothetical protein